MLSHRSSSFIRKADRHEVSTFSLTATIIVVKSFLRIQVIAYISTTDVRRIVRPYFRLVIQMRNLWAYSEDGGPLTVNGAFQRSAGFRS